MTELDKNMILAVAQEADAAVGSYPGVKWLEEYSRRLVAKLSEGQKPVGYFQHIDGLDSTVCPDGYWEEVFPNTEGCVPLFSGPPLAADTRTLDVLRQALAETAEAIRVFRNEEALKLAGCPPSNGLLDALHAADTLITELEAGVINQSLTTDAEVARCEQAGRQQPINFNAQSMDAAVWAKSFASRFTVWSQAGGVESDTEGLMIGWFANAIMAGFDEATRRSEARSTAKEIKPHIIRELVNDLRDIAIKYHDHQSLRERIAHRVRDVWSEAGAAAPAVPDGLVRYCRECGRIGEVPAGFRDCCPDGSHAAYVHPEIARQAKAGFDARLAAAPQPAALPKGCHRSHPHEDMSNECQRKTIEAREANRRVNHAEQKKEE